jgi:hypothetical protein
MAGKGLRCLIVLVALLASTPLAAAQEAVSTSLPGTVIVEWTTESEVNLAGFNVYRSESRDGRYVRLNETLIPASPDPIAGDSYSFSDATARVGVTYYYKLEDVELDGKATMHGPITVVAAADSGAQPFSPGIAALILVGTLVGAAALWATRRRSSPARP